MHSSDHTYNALFRNMFLVTVMYEYYIFFIFQPFSKLNIMKTKILLTALSAMILLTAFVLKPDAAETLGIGSKAPMSDLKMKDVSGTEMSLEDNMGENGLLVIFTCNTCPFVIGRGSDSEGWEGRYNEVASQAKNAGVGSIFINSNEAKRDQGDSFDDMVKRAQENRYTFNYTLDKNHVLADAFGAKTTPHVFLFDSKFKLVYKGAIDDNNDNAADVKEKWLENALSSLKEGKKIDPKETRNIGCSIKRVKKG